MKNIMYSTTRQWNCGDEFILMGCINLLNNVLGCHNPIIYNRNPDIRPENGEDVFYRNNKLPLAFASSEKLVKNSAKYHYGFNDNSIKFNTDTSYVDFAVFAGSPEWLNSRCKNFYFHILKNNIPTLILGVGSYIDDIPDYMEEVISKSLIFTVRDKDILNSSLAKNCGALYLPCPALFSVQLGKEKTINEVKSIGLVYQANYKNSVRCNCIDDESHAFCIALYKKIIEKYNNCRVSIICHYIDELTYATKLFGNLDVDIFYSYDSKDYLDIYSRFDLVISPRVHGCGLSSSLGIPSFIIKHDNRGNTADGFKAKEIRTQESITEVLEKIDAHIGIVAQINKELKDWKNEIYHRYIVLLSQAIQNNKVLYCPKYANMSQGKTLNMLSSINMNYKIYRFLSEITFGKIKTFCKERKYMYKKLRENYE